MRGAVFGDPEVVGVEAGLLVVEVLVIAQHHADGGIEDLGRHAVALLIGEPRVGVPAAAVHVLERHAVRADLLGRLARRCDEAHRDRLAHPVDDEHVAAVIAAL